MKNIDELVSSYYEQQNLNDFFVDDLLRRGRNTVKRKKIIRYCIAALLVFSIIPIVITAKRTNSLNKVIKEIAANHLKNKNVLFSSPEFDYIQKKLNTLDFSIQPSRYFNNGEYELIGGRYCSLLGQHAAQLKVRHQTLKTIHTLYAAPLSKTLRWIKEEKGSSNGVTVLLWSEGSTLFGITI